MMSLRNIKAKWKCPNAIAKIRKAYLYRVLAVGVVLLSSIYLIDFTTNHLDGSHKLFHKSSEDYTTEEYDDNYFVKTSGCRIMKMDVMNDQIRSFFPTEKDKPKQIDCGAAPAITDSDERHVWINLTESELKQFYNTSSTDLQCYFKTFTRLSDYAVTQTPITHLLHFGQRTKIDSEFIQVFCENGNQSQLYIDFHSFFPEMKSDEKTYKKYNVMILGIDSVSKLNFHRMLNRTLKTILEDLNGIELHGYNKVDDNTFPNLIPLLTGLSAEELNGK